MTALNAVEAVRAAIDLDREWEADEQTPMARYLRWKAENPGKPAPMEHMGAFLETMRQRSLSIMMGKLQAAAPSARDKQIARLAQVHDFDWATAEAEVASMEDDMDYAHSLRHLGAN